MSAQDRSSPRSSAIGHERHETYSDPGTMRGRMSDATESATSNTSTYVRPRTRQRIHKPPPPLEVPDINHDAEERKRVLNVLAQRRYRERKKQRKAASPSTTDASTTARTAENGAGESLVQEEAQPPAAAETVQDVGRPVEPDFSSIDLSTVDVDFGPSWDSGATGPSGNEASLSSALIDSLLPCFSEPSAATIDPAALLPTSSSTPSSSSTPMSTDSYHLPVFDLNLLRAFLRIANRLNINTSVWDLGALSAFYQPPSATPSALPPPPSDLPPTWRPTPGQLLVPHHPILDLLPWPTARERIIRIMSLPEFVRPPAASGPLALVEFTYDLEDAAEGMRVYADPCDAGSWEVGQKVFERWWFIFDRDIVEQSNRWREARGAAKLSLNGVDMCVAGCAAGAWESAF